MNAIDFEQRTLVSVVIPAFNSKKYIKATLESVIHQTYRNLEVIVVDDGSTDGTADYVESLGYSSVKVVRQENGGPSVARNRGILESKGEYVKFFDSDDILCLDAIEKQLKHSESLNSNEISIGKFLCNGSILTPQSDNVSSFMTPLPLFRRTVLEAIGGFDSKMKFWEDAELFYNCIAHGFRFILCNDLIYEYRFYINPDCVTNRRREWTTMAYFYLKHKGTGNISPGNIEYNRHFVKGLFIHNTNPLDDPSAYYYFLRKQMPFRIHPAQICGSRIAGYLVWYGAYFLPYEWLYYITTRMLR